MTKRVYNFGAGPSVLPLAVLEKIHSEWFDWHGRGISIVELGHRTDDFQAMILSLENNVRQLMSIPNNYKIIFLGAGARLQFAMLPLNLMGDKKSADYITTGYWSALAASEARRYTSVNIVANNEDTIPDPATWTCDKNAAYFHYAWNETLTGLQFDFIPDAPAPLVVDTTSMILSEHIPVEKFGVIYAATTKNLGIAGLTMLIIREDLFDRAHPMTPLVCDYKAQAAAHSGLITPPTFAVYVAELMSQWLLDTGGVAEREKLNRSKAEILYRCIDQSPFYQNKIEPRFRSKMSVTFTLPTPELDTLFLAEAEKRSLCYLKGHSVKGGMRASIYNAMSIEGVQALVDFMQDFEKRHG